MTKADSSIKTSITLPKSLFTQMREYCERKDENRSQLIRKAVKAYMEMEK